MKLDPFWWGLILSSFYSFSSSYKIILDRHYSILMMRRRKVFLYVIYVYTGTLLSLSHTSFRFHAINLHIAIPFSFRCSVKIIIKLFRMENGCGFCSHSPLLSLPTTSFILHLVWKWNRFTTHFYENCLLFDGNSFAVCFSRW